MGVYNEEKNKKIMFIITDNTKNITSFTGNICGCS